MNQVIIWDLDPEMIRLFYVLPLRYYSICFALGLILGYLLVSNMLKKEQVSEQHIERLAVYIFIGTLAGARLGHCLFYEFDYYQHHILEIFLPFRFGNGTWQYTGFLGLASHGGVLGVLIAILYFSFQTKLKLFYLLDSIAIGGALAAIFIRIGNFMNSEIIGVPTDGSYGVIFKRIDAIPRHPAQLYESFAYLVIFIILMSIHRKEKFKNRPGVLFGVFFTLLFCARFLIEFVKQNQVAFESDMTLNMGQWLSLPFIFFGIIIIILKNK